MTHPRAPRAGARRSRCGAALLGALALAACPPPEAFRMSVTFVGPVEVEAGAEVRYQGVRVGEVERVSLRQAEPTRPARVELALRIEDPEVTLREADVFEIVGGGLLGQSHVRVTPAQEASPPLEPGAVVVGLPPFVTRVRESTSETLDALADLARQKRDALLDALERGAEAGEGSPAPDTGPERP